VVPGEEDNVAVVNGDVPVVFMACVAVVWLVCWEPSATTFVEMLRAALEAVAFVADMEI